MMEYTFKPRLPGLFIRKIICFLRGHDWKATWSPSVKPMIEILVAVGGGYLEVYCARCLDGVALSMVAQPSGTMREVKWWIFRHGIRIPRPYESGGEK